MDQTPADQRTPHVRCLREREEGQRGRGELGWLGGHLLGRLAAPGAGGDGRRWYRGWSRGGGGSGEEGRAATIPASSHILILTDSFQGSTLGKKSSTATMENPSKGSWVPLKVEEGHLMTSSFTANVKSLF